MSGRGCFVRLLFLILTFGVIVGMMGLLVLLNVYVLHDLDSQGWDEGVLDLLGGGIQVGQHYVLTAAGEALARRVGIDPQILGRAFATSAWLKQQTRGEANVGPAILVVLTSGESAQCQNAGRCPAAREMRARGFSNDLRALVKFLVVWREYDIRSDPNSFSAKYIGSNYSLESVVGSCGAGALGCSQFMPGTANIHYDEIEPPFDLWNPDTAMKLMALELHRLGWDENQSVARKAQVLLGWNRAPNWVSQIAQTAERMKQMGLYLTTDVGVSIVETFGVGGIPGLEGGWHNFVLGLLDILGLGPSEEARQQLAGPKANFVSLLGGEGQITLDLGTEAPPGGEMRNVAKWSQLNSRWTIQPEQVWSFCAQTSSTGWSQYEHAAGVPAGGICINASMLKELADADPRLEINEFHPHRKLADYPRYHTVVMCPGTDLRLKNVSDTTLTIVWQREGDNLSVSIAEPLPTLAKGEIDTKSLFGRSVRAEGGGNLRISSAGVDQALDALGVSDEVDVTFRFVPQKELDAIFEGAQAYVWEAVHAPAKEGQVVIIISKTLHTGSLGWSKEAGVAHELLRVAMAFEGDPDWDSLDLRTRSWTEAVPLAQRFELLESRGTPR